MRNIWIGAILFAAIGYGALVALGGHAEIPQYLRDADIAFIGSSLTRHAIPDHNDVEDIFGDGRRHVRLAVLGAKEKDTTELVAVAFSAGIKQIYVEVLPYIGKRGRQERVGGDWAAATDWAGGLAHVWAHQIETFGRKARNAIRAGLGSEPEGIVSKVANGDTDMSEVFDGDDPKRRHKRSYDHRPEYPEELRAVVVEAKRKEVRLVFMSYPHSQMIADFVGPESFAEMVEEMEIFARDFDVEAWVPALSFSNEYFRDSRHLNQRGRERFLKLFREKFMSGDEHG